MPYHHIMSDERVKIEAWLEAGWSQSDIALQLGRHRSTIMRELDRNFYSAGIPYDAKRAEKRHVKVRRETNAKFRKIMPDSDLEKEITELIQRYWSPEQIAGRMRRERQRIVVCHETIYKWIYEKEKERSDKLIPFLRHGKKRRYRRRYGTKIREKRREEAKKKRIDERPEVVERRSRLGDFEGDTIVGSEKTIHIITHVDRKSGQLFADKVDGACAENVRLVTAARFKEIPKKKLRTITYDNGVQFAEHETLERDLGVGIYFAYPYHSWERGTNENTNGLLRQFFPKRSAFKNVTQGQIDDKVLLINTRPRKRLSYLMPNEVWNEFVAV